MLTGYLAEDNNVSRKMSASRFREMNCVCVAAGSEKMMVLPVEIREDLRIGHITTDFRLRFLVL